MISPLIDATFSLVRSVGLPALFVLFVLKGAIVGKPFPTSVFLPGYLLAVSATTLMTLVGIAVASVGYVCGQLIVYFAARQYGLEAIQSHRWINLSDEQAERADDLFQRYSGAGVFVTNLVPYLGSFILIPAGLADYPVGRLTVYALVSTVINYVLIVWLVVGSVQLLTPL